MGEKERGKRRRRRRRRRRKENISMISFEIESSEISLVMKR
jgi:hypothetical protein